MATTSETVTDLIVVMPINRWNCGATAAIVTGSGTSYNIAVTGMTNNGTVTVTIAANTMTDTISNNNAAIRILTIQ
ncbi:MAG: hypothetical protein R3E08_13735 [Thiotrichaceae bacterium]